jgi:hypothetical protein
MAKRHVRGNRESKKPKQPKKASTTAYAQSHAKLAAAPGLLKK